MNAIQKKISKLVLQLQKLREEIIHLDRFGVDMKLAPPAPSEEIVNFEKTSAIKLPPSYRCFLEMHNGWYLFWPDWSLIGVSGILTQKMQTDVRRTMKSYKNIVHRDGDAKVDDLKENEKRRRDVIYPPHHPVMATDFNGGLMVFDRNRKHVNGEYEIVELRYATVQYRFRDFTALLKYAISDIKAEIQEYLDEHADKPKRKRKS